MKKIPALFALISMLIFFVACKKVDNTPPTDPAKSPSGSDTTVTVPPVTPIGRTLALGTGSGALIIDGTTISLKCNDLIKIKGGTYTGITIKNILSADGCPITIKNDGLVQVSGDFNQMSLQNIKNVTISGDGTSGIAKGFVFRDNKYRAIQVDGTLDAFTLQYISFINIADMDISFQYQTAYTGADNSYSKNLRFLNISCDNTNQFLGTAGSVANGVITGLIKNIEIANLDFRNSPTVGAVVYLGNAEDYNIHNNRVDNVNTAINNHNGIFSISGNGKFYNNYVSNHQGNSIRAWGHTVGSTPKYIYIYNNIVVNSRKYSGFEVQAFDANIVAGKTTFANAVVFNNTVGNLNTTDDWQGNIVDVYSLKGGTCNVYNNLAFNLQTGSFAAGQESDLVPVATNNLIFKTSADAGLVDQTSFRLTSNSPAKKGGKATPFVIADYYGALRAALPSIGAVE